MTPKKETPKKEKEKEVPKPVNPKKPKEAAKYENLAQDKNATLPISVTFAGGNVQAKVSCHAPPIRDWAPTDQLSSKSSPPTSTA